MTIAALAAMAVLMVPGVGHAACETNENTASGLTRARAVFVGTVTAVENNARTATFDVAWVWKGEGVIKEVTVHGGATELTEIGADDRYFQVGITYLVASDTATNPYQADLCTATRPWSGIGSTIPPNFQAAVGAETGWAPDPVPPPVVEKGSILDNPIVPVLTGIAVVIGLGFAISRVARGPGHSTAPSKRSRKKLGRRSRLPSLGRSGGGRSLGVRRSGVSQAQKLRGIRNGKKGRKASRKARRKGAKVTSSAPAAGDDAQRETTKV